MRHPDQVALLRHDTTLIPSAVEEMLRWATPVKNMNRTATRDVDLCGQRIHEGDRMLLLYPSANRDEAVFDDPQRFDVTRDPNPHVAFGATAPRQLRGRYRNAAGPPHTATVSRRSAMPSILALDARGPGSSVQFTSFRFAPGERAV